MEQFSKIRLLTDKYMEEGAKKFDTGYIIEVYEDGKYEVEFANPETGIDYAMIAASEEDLEKVE